MGLKDSFRVSNISKASSYDGRTLYMGVMQMSLSPTMEIQAVKEPPAVTPPAVTLQSLMAEIIPCVAQ